MKNKKIIIAFTAILIVAVTVVCVIVFTGNDKYKTADNPSGSIIIPLTENNFFVTDVNDSAITVEGILCTPADENPPVADIDSPDYFPDDEEEKETVKYIYKNHSFEIKNGSGYLTIDYKKTKDDNASSEFSIILDDEGISEINDLYITCNGYTEKVWEK